MRRLSLMRLILVLVFGSLQAASASSAGNRPGDFIEMPVSALEDKIRGGLLAQLLGNLNGLPHENKYYEEPGNVEQYTPALAEGARTDDDTDIEWVYIVAMQKAQTSMLQPEQITQLWKKHINSNIWCSNLYVRRLMDIGINPPLTGNLAINPWASFNISGQFVCEMFGMVAPAMPQTAGRIGLNYTHVSIDGEPAQTTQLFTAMVATAFVSDEVDSIIDAGLASIDPASSIAPIIADVRRWHKENPNDWRATRRLIRDKYTLYESRTRNQNGYELCTAATIAALLYGNGDLVGTLRHAFNFGWDADNNAATAGAIVGVIKGNRWMRQQGWTIQDRYRNTTRPGMPDDETITRFGDRIIEVARRVIVDNGGTIAEGNGSGSCRIRIQKPANIEKLANVDERRSALRSQMKAQIEAALTDGAAAEKARAAYLAICLGLAEPLGAKDANQWKQAVAALEQHPEVLNVLFNSPGPSGDQLRAFARAAGLKEPPRTR